MGQAHPLTISETQSRELYESGTMSLKYRQDSRMCIMSPSVNFIILSLSSQISSETLNIKKKKKVYMIVFKGSKDGGAREIGLPEPPSSCPIGRRCLLQEWGEQASPWDLAEGGNERFRKIRRLWGTTVEKRLFLREAIWGPSLWVSSSFIRESYQSPSYRVL